MTVGFESLYVMQILIVRNGIFPQTGKHRSTGDRHHFTNFRKLRDLILKNGNSKTVIAESQKLISAKCIQKPLEA